MAPKKIVLVDGNHVRGLGIWQAIAKYNVFSQHEACFDSIWKQTAWRNEGVPQADLFLLHLNDQTFAGMPFHPFVQLINRNLPDALIVLYSGGGIAVVEHTQNRLILRQGNKVWDFAISSGSQIAVVLPPVNSISDLNIVAALEKLTNGGTQKDFLNEVLINRNTRSDILSALAMLCQGCLVVHANPDGTPACEASDPAYQLCQEALAKMGWVDFCASNEAGRFCQLAAQRDRVAQPVWWRQVLNYDQANCRRLAVEFKNAATPAVANLVTAIFDEKNGPVGLGLVAKAYLELAQALETP